MMAIIQIVATGGTIASLPQANGDVTAAISGEHFLHRYGVAGEVQIHSSVTKGSFAFDYQTLHDVANDVLEIAGQPDVSGVVVTHGTDTMEETAFFLSMVAGGMAKPVVITGAQLDASHPTSDGTRNLADAIRVAQTPEAANWRAVVVFGGFIHSAREVRKVDTCALEAFDSPGYGAVGRVDEDRVLIARRLPEFPTLPLAIPEPVALIRLGVGMTGKEFRHMADGYRGVVVEAFGRGNGHPSLVPEVESLVKQGVPVVVTSRCLRGPVYPVYGGGGGRDLERAGAWFAGDLSGEKARLLLGLLLGNGFQSHEMAKIVSAYSTPCMSNRHCKSER
jgi:L-asparaginase